MDNIKEIVSKIQHLWDGMHLPYQFSCGTSTTTIPGIDNSVNQVSVRVVPASGETRDGIYLYLVYQLPNSYVVNSIFRTREVRTQVATVEGVLRLLKSCFEKDKNAWQRMLALYNKKRLASNIKYVMQILDRTSHTIKNLGAPKNFTGNPEDWLASLDADDLKKVMDKARNHKFESYVIHKVNYGIELSEFTESSQYDDKMREKLFNKIWSKTHKDYRGKLENGIKVMFVDSTEMVTADSITDKQINSSLKLFKITA